VFATAAPRRDFPRLAALFFQALIAPAVGFLQQPQTRGGQRTHREPVPAGAASR